jgi:hypothetical protein
VRTLFLIALCAALACAQNANTLYTTDLNGNRVVASINDTARLPDGTSKRELSQSVNGRTVPLETTETHVTKSGNHITTEQIITRFDPTGNLSVTERVVSERDTLSSGGFTESSRTYRSDLSGMKEIERRQVDTRVQGSTTSQDTVITRPGTDGSFQTAEKRSAESMKSGDRVDTKETVYRRSQSGELYPALQQVKSATKTGQTTKEQVADYEPSSLTGTMQLARQSVSTVTTDKAGNQTQQVDLYAPAADGHVQETGAPQQIKEQQLITKRVASDGSVTETLSVRRPFPSDPTKLGDVQPISQTICTGKCLAPPAP